MKPQNTKQNFKSYMHIQVRYIKFISSILNISDIQVIETYGKRYKELYYIKYDYIY